MSNKNVSDKFCTNFPHILWLYHGRDGLFVFGIVHDWWALPATRIHLWNFLKIFARARNCDFFTDNCYTRAVCGAVLVLFHRSFVRPLSFCLIFDSRIVSGYSSDLGLFCARVISLRFLCLCPWSHTYHVES